jgi:hypothetical protein
VCCLTGVGQESVHAVLTGHVVLRYVCCVAGVGQESVHAVHAGHVVLRYCLAG